MNRITVIVIGTILGIVSTLVLAGYLICGANGMEGDELPKDKFDYKYILKITNSGSDTEKLGHFDELHDNIFKQYLEQEFKNMYKFQRLMITMADIYEDYIDAYVNQAKNIELFMEKNNDNCLPKELKHKWFKVFIINGHDPKLFDIKPEQEKE